MRSIVVIVANIIGKKSFQVSLVHRNDVIEQITAAAFHPALGHSVLPGTPDRGSHAGDSQGANGRPYFQAVFLIVIKQQELRGRFVRKRFSQLLRDPTAGGMTGDVEVRNLSPVMCLMIKKQYSSWNVTVGTVKKSMAAMASR